MRKTARALVRPPQLLSAMPCPCIAKEVRRNRDVIFFTSPTKRQSSSVHARVIMEDGPAWETCLPVVAFPRAKNRSRRD